MTYQSGTLAKDKSAAPETGFGRGLAASVIPGLAAAGTVLLGGPLSLGIAAAVTTVGILAASARKLNAASSVAAATAGGAAVALTSVLTGGLASVISACMAACVFVATGANKIVSDAVSNLRGDRTRQRFAAGALAGSALSAALTYGAAVTTPQTADLPPVLRTGSVAQPGTTAAALTNNFAVTAEGLKPLAATGTTGHTIIVPSAPRVQPS